MFIELQDRSSREATYKMHQSMTVRALCVVFDRSEGDATEAVRALWARYAEAPVSTRDRLVHEDPLNLAAEIAEMPWPRDLDSTDPEKTIADLQKLKDEDPEHPLPWIELVKEPFATRIQKYNIQVRDEFERLGVENYSKRKLTPFEKTMVGG
jgi:hypothetical protein